MRKIPPADYRPEYLDRQVIFDVELPDGAAHGPVIDRLELARLRLVSGPKFRALRYLERSAPTPESQPAGSQG